MWVRFVGLEANLPSGQTLPWLSSAVDGSCVEFGRQETRAKGGLRSHICLVHFGPQEVRNFPAWPRWIPRAHSSRPSILCFRRRVILHGSLHLWQWSYKRIHLAAEFFPTSSKSMRKIVFLSDHQRPFENWRDASSSLFLSPKNICILVLALFFFFLQAWKPVCQLLNEMQLL